jgi:SAM-dependent methyltransferase
MRTMLTSQGDVRSRFPLLYDLHHASDLEDIPFWLSLAAEANGAILELGCGTGRVLAPLVQHGYRVYGIDQDPAMPTYLLQARRLGTNRWLICAEASRFHLGVTFSLVIFPCNTYSSLPVDERLQVLQRVREHLSPGGIFAASLPNPAILWDMPEQGDPELEEIHLHPLDDSPVQISSAWERSPGQFKITWTYDHLFPDGGVERTRVDQIQLLTPPETYLSELKSMGFHALQTFGDFERTSYSKDSPYLIILARR